MANKTNILSRNTIEELIPDIAFGRASDEEKQIFESSIASHPDLEREFLRIKGAFSELDFAKYEDSINHRVRNLSVKVNERLNKQSKTNGYSVLWKYIMPAAAVVVISYFSFFQRTETIDTVNVQQTINVFPDKVKDNSPSEKLTAVPESNTIIERPVENNRKVPAVKASQNIDLLADAGQIEESISEELLGGIKSDSDMKSVLDEVNEFQLIENTNNFNDIYFESLIEELENEKI